MSSLLTALDGQRLLVVTGKGGVGKTSASAALGVTLARRGRRVIVVESDPRESLHQMLGSEPSDGRLMAAGPGLWFENLRTRSAVDRVVARQVRLGWLARRVFDSPVYEQFATGAPGVKELSLLGYVIDLLEGRIDAAPEVDLVILDAPATGHGRSLLTAPELVAGVISEGPFGRMTERVAEVVGDPQTTGVVVVTLAEEMAVNETLELIEGLRDELDRAVLSTIVNAVYPKRTSRSEPADALERLWAARRAVNELQLERLRGAGVGKIVQLPLLPIERGRPLIEVLADALGEGSTEAAFRSLERREDES